MNWWLIDYTVAEKIHDYLEVKTYIIQVQHIYLRMYCIDTHWVPENSDAGTFHCLYD